MAQSLPHLHDPHNSSVNLVLTVLKDSLRGAGLLLHLEPIRRLQWKPQYLKQREDTATDTNRLFHLDLVNFDPEEFVFEVVVAWKLVAVLHVFTFWDLGEHTSFPAGERLQSAPQLVVLYKDNNKK